MRNRLTFMAIIYIFVLMLAPLSTATAQIMDDYTAYPPFVSNAVEPNILLVLDQSGSMQFPAYVGCDFTSYDNSRAQCGTSDTIANPELGYRTTDNDGNDNLYYGYFETDKYYQYDTNKFVENTSCTSWTSSDAEYLIGDSSTCISGNLLNWATMSRIDLMRKVLIGGKSVSTQTNAHTLRGEGGWRTFTDYNLGCTFTINGGSFPNLDHNVAISDAGACGYLSVEANGSIVFGTSDSFRYIYQSVTGDFDAALRVITPPYETEQTYAKAGLMVRTSTNADSQHVKAMATYGAGLQFSDRLTDGGSTNLVGDYVSSDYPVWVRISRSGDTFTYYYSSNGTTWTTHGTSTVTMPSTVLIGMASSSYSSGTLGTAKYDEFTCDSCTNDNFNSTTFNTTLWTAVDINTSTAGSQTQACPATCQVGTLTASNLKVDVPENERRGIIQNLSDKDYDAQWDADSPRFGLMVFAGDGREGEMKVGIDGSNMSSFLTSLQGEAPYHGTPTGEALYEAYDYFKQSNDHNYLPNTSFIGSTLGSNKDPMYENGVAVGCRKNFVLLISDGEWNGSVDPVRPSRENYVSDIRSDIEGFQSISTYTVFTFNDAAAGRNSLQQVAMFGDFDDYDSDTWPYNRTDYPTDSRLVSLPASPCPASATADDECREWDKEGSGGIPDGIPDNYYEATDGNELEAKLIEAISDILKRAASGTAVSILSTSGEGEGAVYQAYFFPQQLEELEDRKWLGYINALFVDEKGNLREDTNTNQALDLTTDLILRMSYSETSGTEVYKCSDTDGDSVIDSCPSTPEPLSTIEAIWKGGESLWNTSPDSRDIKTSLDGNTITAFTVANATLLEPRLRAADTTEAENIINWIRGADLPGTSDTAHPDGYRKRDITIDGTTNIWKLGDIVYSSPTVVGPPMENYDDLYNDSSYREFEVAYNKRRHVVYVGANDGMLHAFNAGCYDSLNHMFYSDVSGSNCVSGSHSLGEELWSFIPGSLLPHLKWLTMPEYTHVYYVDLKPKVTDVKIFDSDATHVNGWGTILIGGLRYGGDDISWTSGGTNYSESPEYFAFDITDADNPVLLWSFSHADLGLSMSYPSVANVDGTWYAIFGSGATEFDTQSNLTTFQDGNIFVLRISGAVNGVISSWTQNDNYWIIPTNHTTALMADSITVDYERVGYGVDTVYIGENYQQGNSWLSLMRRITTGNGTITNPASWTLSTLLDVNAVAGNNDDSKKITAAPSAASDDKQHLWVFFGTGQYYGLNDKNQTDTGAFYGVKDSCWRGNCTTPSTSLLDVSSSTVDTSGNVAGVSGACAGATTTWNDLITAANSCEGWSIYFSNLGESTDFAGRTLTHSGERVFSKPLVLGELVSWGAYIPGTDECSYLGESNAYGVYYKTGTAYKTYVFDEQKSQASPSSTVARVSHLGTGMPSSPSGHVSPDGTVNIYFQNSTGAVLSLGMETPYRLISDVEGWKEENIP